MAGIRAMGAKLSYTNTGEKFIAHLTSLGSVKINNTEIDVTDHDSPDGKKNILQATKNMITYHSQAISLLATILSHAFGLWLTLRLNYHLRLNTLTAILLPSMATLLALLWANRLLMVLWAMRAKSKSLALLHTPRNLNSKT